MEARINSKKLALLLAVACILLSAITLFSALSHASAANTITFFDRDNLAAQIKTVSLLSKDQSVLVLNIEDLNFLEAKNISLVYVKFSDFYEASAAGKVLIKERVSLETACSNTTGSRWGLTRRKVTFVDYDNNVTRNPVAASVSAEDVTALRKDGGKTANLSVLATDQIRSDEKNLGIYPDTLAGKLQKYLDSQECVGIFNDSRCHIANHYVK